MPSGSSRRRHARSAGAPSARKAAAAGASVRGTAAPLTGLSAQFGGPALADNPLNEAGSFTVTSDVLPVSRYPQFRSQASAAYLGVEGGAFDPVEGDWYVGTAHGDDVYTRLARPVDLSSVTAAQAPSLDLQLSYDTEEAYDHVLVEVHTAPGEFEQYQDEIGAFLRSITPEDRA